MPTSALGCRRAEAGMGSSPKQDGCGQSSSTRPGSAGRSRLAFGWGICCLVGSIVHSVVGRADLSKLLPHAEVQKDHGTGQEQHDDQGSPTRLDRIRVRLEQGHAETLLSAGTAIPANRSLSGMLV